MPSLIKPGETTAALKTITFPVFSSDGLLATGGAEDNWESNTVATSSGATMQVQNNLGSWSTAAGTFGHNGGGEYYYIFDNTEVQASLSTGSVAFRFAKTNFRTQTARVDFRDVDVVTTAIKAKTDNLPSDPADHSLIMDELRAIGGLLHRNSMADNFTYDLTTGDMLTCRIRVFASSAALAAAVAGHADNTDGEVARYTMTGTLLAGKPSSFKARQVL